MNCTGLGSSIKIRLDPGRVRHGYLRDFSPLHLSARQHLPFNRRTSISRRTRAGTNRPICSRCPQTQLDEIDLTAVRIKLFHVDALLRSSSYTSFFVTALYINTFPN